MKIKTRNLLTVILSMLCAVAVAIGVSFILPKTQKSANAAVATSVSGADVNVSFGSVKSYYKSTLGITTHSYSSMSSGMGSASGGASGGAGSGAVNLSIPISSGAVMCSMVVYPVVLKLNVPAHTVFTIEYSTVFTFGGTLGCAMYISENWTTTTATDAANGNFSGSFAFQNLTGIGYRWWSAPTAMSGGDTGGKLLMYNDTASAKDIYAYNMFCAEVYDGDRATKTHTFNFSINNFIISGVKINAPTAVTTTPATYDGSFKSFSFNYATPSYTEGGISANYTDAYYNIKPTVTAEDFDGNPINTSDPTKCIIDNLDSNGIPTSASGSFKATEAGIYTVKFDFSSDAISNGMEWTDGSTSTQPLTFTINPAKVTVPVAPEATDYTGSAQTVALTYFNAANIKTDSVTSVIPANTATVTDADGNPWTDETGSFKITNADTYTVTLKLRDDKNYVWGDTAGGNGTRTAKIEITQKELGLSFTSSSLKSGKAVWEAGATATITVTDGRVSTDNLSLVFYYDEITKTVTGTTTGNSTEITMPTNIAVGKHKLYVELNGSTGDNANYKITKNNTYDFEVTSASADTELSWTYSENGTEVGAISENDQKKYKLNTEYSVEVVLSAEQKDYINIKGYTNQKSSTVGKVETTVTLESTDSTKLFPDENGNNTLTTTTVTFKWEIIKGDIDLSKVEWEYEYTDADGKKQTGKYTDALEYNDGRNITVKVKESTLPTEFSLLTPYSESKYAVDTYTTTVSDMFYDYDMDSFNAPSPLTLNWEIKKKNLGSQWTIDKQKADSGITILVPVLKIPSTLKDRIDYKYYDITDGADGAEVTLADIKAAATSTVIRTYKVVATVNADHVDGYELNGGGADPFKTFATGSNNKVATPMVDDKTENITAVYDGKGHFGADSLKVVDENKQTLLTSDYTVVYYKGSVADGNEFTGELVDAGTYVIVFALTPDAEEEYVLETEWVTVKILPKPIALPSVGAITFDNTFVELEKYLGGSYTEYKDIAKIELGGRFDGVKMAGETYYATLTIKNPNYCWETDSDEKTETKLVAKYALATDSAGWDVTDSTVATLAWNIKPFVLKASNWNVKGKDGAVYKIPTALTDGLDGDIQLWYYTSKASEDPLGADEKLKAGNTYYVKAELLGDYKDCFVFENSEEGKPYVSDFATYKLSKTGAAAAIDTFKGFMLGTLLGLPVWAWLVIALALIILLIIIIAVCAKRRKTKEQREEIKARKEEERQRREDERRIQQERLQAERELAMAKQQAELEKIRMQSGMAGAGMASMAMQQAAPQQQPVQQSMQSAPVDSSVLAEIKAELAEIKARQNMGAGYSQSSMQYGNDPVAAAELIRLKAENEAHMRAELERARSEAERARMEAELARVRAESRYAYPSQQFDGNMPGGDMQKIGALAVAIWQSMNKTAEPAEVKAPEVPQITEESASTSAMYPPDAIVTTTTTVDTTQKPLRRERGENSERNDFVDVDGFYDSID